MIRFTEKEVQEKFYSLPFSERYDLKKYTHYAHVIVIDKKFKEEFRTKWSYIKENRTPSVLTAVNRDRYLKKKFKSTPLSKTHDLHMYVKNDTIVIKCKETGNLYKSTWQRCENNNKPTAKSLWN